MPSVPLTSSDGRSETEITQDALGREDASIELIASVLLERDQPATALSNGNERLSELEEELLFMKVEKCSGGNYRSASSRD